MTHYAELLKGLRSLSPRHSIWEVFSDFLLFAATSLSNAVDARVREEREKEYMSRAARYTKEEMTQFAQCFGLLVEAVEESPEDILGKAYMDLEVSDKHTGQFFTPYCLCQMMAKMQVDDRMRSLIEQHGFIRASEPACGGGAMIIALAQEMRAAGINYQQKLHVTAQDLDIKSVHMTYIQLTLLHVPAVVIHGNTLLMEERSRWLTPAHIMGMWDFKIRRREAEDDRLEELRKPRKNPRTAPTSKRSDAAVDVT